MDQTKLIIELVRNIENLNLRIQQLEIAEKENKILRTRLSGLEEQNSELKSRLNTNSRNSSKPPSSDGYQKKACVYKTKQGYTRRAEGASGTDIASKVRIQT